jgi:sulfide:quinone oxidoreductase
MARTKVVVVGGGTAGITVAARIRRTISSAEVVIVEPSAAHYYQPLWTLVGAGACRREETLRDESSVIPSGASWLRDAVTEFLPHDNIVTTRDGRRLEYDYLVVAPGIQMNWHGIKGLQESIGRNGVCSNYSYEHVESTWRSLREFKSGNAIFTMPSTVIRCGGAPQKILYLAEDYLRRQRIREGATVLFVSAGPAIFPVPKYKPALEQIIQERGIQTRFRHELVEIRGERREADFENRDTKEIVTLPYEMIHVTPPMSAPDFVRTSPLANEAGWVDVDQYTLQHERFPNIFSLGDASSLPTAKTGAAIRKQAPVLVDNLRAVMQGRPLEARYDGYTSCPIVTRRGRVLLAEFDYDLQAKETFPFDQAKERWSMWLLKLYMLPMIYWYGMLRGRM